MICKSRPYEYVDGIINAYIQKIRAREGEREEDTYGFARSVDMWPGFF